MIERWKNDDGSETIFVMDEPPHKSLFVRVMAFLGMALLVVLLSALPLMLIIFGVQGLITGQIDMWSRTRGSYKLYGNGAIVAAWLHLAFGIGAIGFIFRESGKPAFKWTLWIISGVCVAAAIYRMINAS